MTDICALIPIKITSDLQFNLFKECFSSYLPILNKYDIQVKIADESSVLYMPLVKNFLEEQNINKEFIKGNGYTDSIQVLIQSVKSKYFFFIVDDVELLTIKDFVEPSLKAFEKNNKLIQIKFGGGAAARKTKKQNLNLYKDYYRESVHGSDIVWINKIVENHEKYIFSHYNCILRTDIFQQLDKKIANTAISNWDAYVVVLKTNF